MDIHCSNNDFYIMQLNIEIIELKIAKEIEKICLEKGLTIEAALKKVARDYSERIDMYGSKKNVY